MRSLDILLLSHLGRSDSIRGCAAILASASGLRAPAGFGPLAREIRRIAGDDGVAEILRTGPRAIGLVHEAYRAKTRKSTGSFYTPEHVTDHIVDRAVVDPLWRRVCAAKGRAGRHAEILSTRVCDPAMGAGFFLLSALDALDRVATSALIKLSRSEIAMACLSGIDLDPDAVLAARLSLWISAHDPDLCPGLAQLSGNLVCGNSFLLDLDAFPGRPANGFHAVIGNPPYGAAMGKSVRRHIASGYVTGRGGYRNTALHFMERCRDLASPHGTVGLIVPKSLVYSTGWKPAVEMIVPGLSEIADASLAFPGVRLEQVVVVFDASSPSSSSSRHKTCVAGVMGPKGFVARSRPTRSTLSDCGLQVAFSSRRDLAVLERVRKTSGTLSDVSVSFRGLGIQRYEDPSGDVEAIGGKQISRFAISGERRRFRLPAEWRTGRLDRMRVPKIVSQNLVAHVLRPEPHIVLASAYDDSGTITLDTVTNTVITDPSIDPWLILALLNSRFVSWFAYRFVFGSAVRTMHLDASYIGRLPLPPRDAIARHGARAAYLARSLSATTFNGAISSSLEKIVRTMYEG